MFLNLINFQYKKQLFRNETIQKSNMPMPEAKTVNHSNFRPPNFLK
jgi:hypothetical protein